MGNKPHIDKVGDRWRARIMGFTAIGNSPKHAYDILMRISTPGAQKLDIRYNKDRHGF